MGSVKWGVASTWDWKARRRSAKGLIMIVLRNNETQWGRLRDAEWRVVTVVLGEIR